MHQYELDTMFLHAHINFISFFIWDTIFLGEESKRKNVILAVDAEYTYTNNAISLVTLALKVTFNDGLPIIWNTYQGYLKVIKVINHTIT